MTDKNKRKGVTIKGAYGDANVGDDLLLEMVMELLKQVNPLYEIKIVCKKEKYLTEMYNDVEFLSLAASKFERSDIYILGGGTQFFSFENSNKKNNFSSKLTLYAKAILLEPMLIYRLLRSKFRKHSDYSLKIALGIGLGPFESLSDELPVRKQLEEYDKIFCRDRLSKAYLEKWQVEDYFFGADLCLTDLFRKKYELRHYREPNAPLQIGIVLRSWSHSDVGNIINDKILNWLSTQNFGKVKIFLFSKDKDEDLVAKITSLKDIQIEELIVWHPMDYTFENFYSCLNECDVLLTSRYHAAIFAVNLSIPTVCLGIDPKLQALSDEVNGFYYWNAEDEISDIDINIENISSTYSEHQDQIRNSYQILNTRANSMITEISNVLKNQA
ncbi:polysaccharide pyruvyl transferase family protein [Sphingobacterium faecium]|uniref:polysaccharide pyruvyl transferase family protein n=1 Tax=Sphingobacterium TaxID=28453 RepID=UPI00161AB3C2|nr:MULTISPECIES: polysaccharide pyruvyl transferase family protein [Sphingobacterium]MBB2954363.1 polysaccharide pyruvyl transferase WcaK-like protein [Sphingobacterium sp. JUb56]UXD69335.1 polysaccharide pyruvyl transferase family protein [Sphingobacterium faecium]